MIDFENILPEFQRFLLDKNIAPQKNAGFYAYWASKFIEFSNDHQELPVVLRKTKFVSTLKENQRLEEWQVQQAESAVNLYIDHYLPKSENRDCFVVETPKDSADNLQFQELYNKMREAIRIKHYSYRTEQSYLDWFRKFYAYLTGIKKKTGEVSGFNTLDVKDYLAYLAIVRKVAASTQNQAFNALLFLFRDVLKTNSRRVGYYSAGLRFRWFFLLKRCTSCC